MRGSLSIVAVERLGTQCDHLQCAHHRVCALCPNAAARLGIQSYYMLCFHQFLSLPAGMLEGLEFELIANKAVMSARGLCTQVQLRVLGLAVLT